MIYYSHINEDNRVERQLLQKSGCTTVISIAGSGERVLALMDNQETKKIIAVDANQEAIFLLQLKIEALKTCSVIDYLKFIGQLSANKEFRLKSFNKIKLNLPESCRHYWENKSSEIAKGILYIGHFEKFLARAKRTLNFLLGRNMDETFNENVETLNFPKWRWKFITWLFSSKWAYRILGNKDKAFISKDARISEIPQALDMIIRKGYISSCSIAQLALNGHLLNMKEEWLPASLQTSVLEKIRYRILSGDLQVEYWCGDLIDYIDRNAESISTSTFYSLSDIVSFQSYQYLEKLLQKITSVPGQIMVWRSFLRNLLDEQDVKHLSRMYGKIDLHGEEEPSGLYQVFSMGANGYRSKAG